LAIAFAAERKRSTPARWQAYSRLEDLMRQFLRRQREGWDPTGNHAADWLKLIEALENLPRPAEPESLQSEYELVCRHLSGVLETMMEKSGAGRHKDEKGGSTGSLKLTRPP